MVSYKNVKNALATLTFWGPVLTKDSQSLHFSSGLAGGERVIQYWSFMMGVEGLKSSTDHVPHFGTVGIAQCPPCMGWGQRLGQRPDTAMWAEPLRWSSLFRDCWDFLFQTLIPTAVQVCSS